MTPGNRVSWLPRLAAGLLVAAGTLLTAPLTMAAGPVFGAPEAKATYGQQIVFTVPLTWSGDLARVELRLVFPDALGPFITDIPVPAAGARSLTYTLDLSGSGHLVPNSRLEATWAAYASADADPVVSSTITVRYEDTEHDWQTLRGDLVTVHWYAGSDAFARKALRIGDDAVRETATLLGVTETAPIDFYIYGDEGSFRAALGPGTRENVGGQAHSDIRTLFALLSPDSINDPWVGIVIPHELVHLVFDTAVRNPYRFPPRWFNEGLAVYLSEGYTRGDRRLVEDSVNSGDLLPLTALTGQFPTDADKTYLAYAESVSAIDHLVRTYGRPALFALVESYADGLTDDEAFTRALGVDLAGFQLDWLKGLGADTPERFGPKPAPPGPLPSGWDGPAPTQGVDGGPGTPSPSATPSPSGTPSPAAGAGDTTAAILTAIAAVLVVVVGAVFLAGRRTRTG